MRLTTELNSDKQQILIIDKHSSLILSHLKEQIKKYDNDVYISPRLPQNISKFDMYFIINENKILDRLVQNAKKKIIFIFINQKKSAAHLNENVSDLKLKNVKIISLENLYEPTPEDIEKILWFSFSRSEENFLTIHSFKIKKKPTVNEDPKKNLFSFSTLEMWFKPKKLITFFIILIIVLHFLFIPPLLISTYFHYLAVKSISKLDIDKTLTFTDYAGKSLSISKKLYSLSRPTFLVLGIVIFPDNIVQINEKTNITLQKALHLYKESSALTTLFLKKDKTQQDKDFFSLHMNSIKNDIDDLDENLSVIYQKLPIWNNQLKNTKESIKQTLNMIDNVQRVFPYVENILGKDSEKKYLLLFANNMEIRPGGGFIGSFGVITFKDFSIKDFKVYDVYDADGQLVAHIEPPAPIKKYLEQPHWFLRDSAFSPDFSDNYKQALFFLDKEMHFSNFDGGMIVTTTAIQNILSSMRNLYIPDFNEMVNKDNFYLKAQMYAEKDFFPGSTQKKRFLASVANQMLINIQDASLQDTLKMVKKSLDEKQMALYFEDQKIQSLMDSLYWSGRTIAPNCAARSDNCVVDYIFPVDANLGVNKANFFISRSISLDIKINSEGTITNQLTIKLKNDSANDAFPGGTYKNYIQIYLPKNIVLKNITKNDVLVEGYDEKDDIYKTIGFYLEVKPQATAVINLRYQLKNTLSTGQGAYQLIVQKQMGSSNSDINLQITLPKNIYIINQNFSPLVKNNTITYNTTLTADKIFFVDLIKE